MDISQFRRHDSKIDASINFIKPYNDGGFIEARHVRRLKDRFIVYISSMSGCDKACRFCHLTQTNQTMASHLSVDEMVEQARHVLENSVFLSGETVHFNFMARGEPLANENVNEHLMERLYQEATERGLKPRVKISTIMPRECDLTRLRHEKMPIDVYYSLYKTEQAWRKRWIPKALDPEEALLMLKRHKEDTQQRIILHWALIDDENDGEKDAEDIVALCRQIGLAVDFNLVRYNPANEKSREARDARRDQYLDVLRRARDVILRVRKFHVLVLMSQPHAGCSYTPHEAKVVMRLQPWRQA